MKTTKRCSKCKDIKLLSEFYKFKRRGKDGFQNYCKACQMITQREYQKTAKGKVSHRKGNRKYLKTENGKVIMRAAAKRFNAHYPNYGKAIHAVNHAIEVGKLSRPDTKLCHYCPSQGKEYHHWHGYELEHRLDVIPVCRKCHQKRKRKIA